MQLDTSTNRRRVFRRGLVTARGSEFGGEGDIFHEMGPYAQRTRRGGPAKEVVPGILHHQLHVALTREVDGSLYIFCRPCGDSIEGNTSLRAGGGALRGWEAGVIAVREELPIWPLHGT